MKCWEQFKNAFYSRLYIFNCTLLFRWVRHRQTKPNILHGLRKLDLRRIGMRSVIQSTTFGRNNVQHQRVSSLYKKLSSCQAYLVYLLFWRIVECFFFSFVFSFKFARKGFRIYGRIRHEHLFLVKKNMHLIRYKNFIGIMTR